MIWGCHVKKYQDALAETALMEAAGADRWKGLGCLQGHRSLCFILVQVVVAVLIFFFGGGSSESAPCRLRMRLPRFPNKQLAR